MQSAGQRVDDYSGACAAAGEQSAYRVDAEGLQALQEELLGVAWLGLEDHLGTRVARGSPTGNAASRDAGPPAKQYCTHVRPPAWQSPCSSRPGMTGLEIWQDTGGRTRGHQENGLRTCVPPPRRARLELRVPLHAVRVVAIAAVVRPDARLGVAHVPWLRAQHAQEGCRVHRARTYLKKCVGVGAATAARAREGPNGQDGSAGDRAGQRRTSVLCGR